MSRDEAYKVNRSAFPWNLMARSLNLAASMSGAANATCRIRGDRRGRPIRHLGQSFGDQLAPHTVADYVDRLGTRLLSNDT